jgi:hypothetical protein
VRSANPEISGLPVALPAPKELRRGDRSIMLLKNMHEVSALAVTARGKAFVLVGAKREDR